MMVIWAHSGRNKNRELMNVQNTRLNALKQRGKKEIEDRNTKSPVIEGVDWKVNKKE